MHIFISHSSTNSTQAAEICGVIEDNGHACFLAPRDIRSGHEYAEEIINGIDGADAMLLLLSQQANDSPHVLREIERAVSKKIPIMVYKLEQVQLSKSMEYFLMTHQWLNEKSDKDYTEIVRSINELDGQQKPADVSGTATSYQLTKRDAGAVSKKILPVAIIAVVAAGVIIGVACSKTIFGGDSTTTEQTAETFDAVLTTAEATLPAVETAEASAPAADSTTTSPVEQTTTTGTVTEQQPEDSEPVETAPVADVQLGDTITLGRYNGEDIKWRVISISDDGATAVVVADDILTMKAYDAPEGGRFNNDGSEYYWNVALSELDAEQQRILRGDNRWEFSNIRTWLNSERENVTYADQAPTAQAMSENKNAYNTEAGFLNSFTDEELSAIAVTQLETNGAVTEDRVFLLSSDQLGLLSQADVSIDAQPTAAAVAADQSNWYTLYSSDFGVSDHYWWLRDTQQPEDHINACEVNVVTNSYTGNKIMSDSAGLEGYGVRPAMTVLLTSEYIYIQ